MEVVSFLVVLGIIFGALFLAVFLMKRRLGLLGLALAAGSILSSMWVGDLTPLVAEAGFVIIRPPLSSIVATMLILLPATLVFFSGAGVKGKIVRFISALVFASLAVAFLLEPLRAALVIDATAKPFYNLLVQYQAVIITVGLGLSLLDLMFGKKLGREREARH